MFSTAQESSRRIQRSDRTLATEAYERVKWDILCCRLPPGQVFSESELVEKFGVSKTPVREALQRLKQEGLVRTIPSVGYEVSAVTVTDITELMEMRRILELAAVERSIQCITDDELDRIERLIGKPFVVGDEETRLRWFYENTEFHSALAAASGIQRLAQTVRAVMEESLRSYFVDEAPFSTEMAVTSHRQLIDALRRRDLQRAKELIEAEVDYGIETTVAVLDEPEVDPAFE